MHLPRYVAGIILLGTFSATSAEVPAVFVDSGACPGEGCGYCGLYVALSDIPVYENPSLTSEQVGEIPSGDTFVLKGGEVHTIPTRFEIHREHKEFKASDEIFVLTYLGEGHFRVFLNGSLTKADLGFSPWGGSGGKTCDNPKRCWGRLDKELEFTWWIWVLAESGMAGWVVGDDSMRQIQNKR